MEFHETFYVKLHTINSEMPIDGCTIKPKEFTNETAWNKLTKYKKMQLIYEQGVILFHKKVSVSI